MNGSIWWEDRDMLLNLAIALSVPTYITGRECEVLRAVLEHESVIALVTDGAEVELWSSPDFRVVFDGTYWRCELPPHVRPDSHREPAEPNGVIHRIQAFRPAMNDEYAAMTIGIREHRA